MGSDEALRWYEHPMTQALLAEMVKRCDVIHPRRALGATTLEDLFFAKGSLEESTWAIQRITSAAGPRRGQHE